MITQLNHKCPYLVICYQEQFTTRLNHNNKPVCSIELEPTGLYCEVLNEFGICCTPDDRRRCEERIDPLHKNNSEVIE